MLLLASTSAGAQWGREPALQELARFDRASLVFATNDLSSPVSLFGHTFLVFHQEGVPEPNALVIEFGGTVHRATDHLGALLGGISGRYSASYLSYKEREYFAEGRSLWIYPLRLEGSALQGLRREVEAAWGRTERYTFQRYNCSHYILELVAKAAGLDRAGPEVPVVVPVDTLRTLSRAGLLGAPVFRPGPGIRAQAAYRALEAPQRLRFESIWLDPDQPGAEAVDSQLAAALSAAAEHMVLGEDQASRRDALYRLKRRSPAALPFEAPAVDPVNSGPHGLWSLTQDLRGSGQFVGWRYGFLLLDNEDRTGLRNAELQLVGFEAGGRPGQLRLTRLDLLSMGANRPTDFLFRGFTQRLDLGYADDSATAGRASKRLLARLGRGTTWQLGPVAASALPFLAVGLLDDGQGWEPAMTAGLRASVYLPMAAGWRARAVVDWNARALAGLRAAHQIEVVMPSLHREHSFGLRVEWRNGQHARALVGIRWSYRPHDRSLAGG